MRRLLCLDQQLLQLEEQREDKQLMSTPIASGGASLHDTSSSRSSMSTVPDSADDAYSLRMLPVSNRNATDSVGITSLPATSNSGRNMAPVNAHFRDPTLSALQHRPVNTLAGQRPPVRGQGSNAGGRGLLQGGRGAL